MYVAVRVVGRALLRHRTEFKMRVRGRFVMPLVCQFVQCALLVALSLLWACVTIAAGSGPIFRTQGTNFDAIRGAVRLRCLGLEMHAARSDELPLLRNDVFTASMVAAVFEMAATKPTSSQTCATTISASISVLLLSSLAGVIGDLELSRGLTTALSIIAGGQKASTTDQLLGDIVSVLQVRMRASLVAERVIILSELFEPYVSWNLCLAFQFGPAYDRAGRSIPRSRRLAQPLRMRGEFMRRSPLR